MHNNIKLVTNKYNVHEVISIAFVGNRVRNELTLISMNSCSTVLSSGTFNKLLGIFGITIVKNLMYKANNVGSD